MTHSVPMCGNNVTLSNFINSGLISGSLGNTSSPTAQSLSPLFRVSISAGSSMTPPRAVLTRTELSFIAANWAVEKEPAVWELSWWVGREGGGVRHD